MIRNNFLNQSLKTQILLAMTDKILAYYILTKINISKFFVQKRLHNLQTNKVII